MIFDQMYNLVLFVYALWILWDFVKLLTQFITYPNPKEFGVYIALHREACPWFLFISIAILCLFITPIYDMSQLCLPLEMI